LGAFDFDTRDMASFSYEPSNIGVGPEMELLARHCHDQVCCQRSVALGILDKERTVSEGMILLVRMVVRNHVLEACSFQTLSDRFKALL